MSEGDVQDAIAALTTMVRRDQRAFEAFAWGCLAARGAKPAKRDVEDALSDAYLTAATRLRHEPDLRIERLDAWFKKILFFKCLRAAAAARTDGLRHVVASLEEEDEFLEIIGRASAAGRHDDQERTLFVQHLLGALDDRARRVVDMSAAGFTSKEIAAELSETAANVRKIRSRALGTLRQLLDD